jgi:hypothetical protein
LLTLTNSVILLYYCEFHFTSLFLFLLLFSILLGKRYPFSPSFTLIFLFITVFLLYFFNYVNRCYPYLIISCLLRNRSLRQ